MSAMQEIRTLAGMFQQILHNCKVRLSYFAFTIFIASRVQIIKVVLQSNLDSLLILLDIRSLDQSALT